jgi:RNA polymerase sigma-B factor
MAAGGSEQTRLVEEYLPLARGAARRLARSPAEREDLVQVAALAVVRAVSRHDPARRDVLPGYVQRSVEGELRRHLRDRASIVRVPRSARGEEGAARRTAAAPLQVGDDALAPDLPLEELTLDRALVARAARALDDRQRRLVLLCFFLDRTQEEAATELGISQPHVSRLLADALRRMRRRLEAGDGPRGL